MAGMGRKGHGSGGSSFNSDKGDFPGVPFTMNDFNGCSKCPACCCINRFVSFDLIKLTIIQ